MRVEERKVEARQRTRTDYVASPDNRGTRKSVQRVVDTLDFLWTRKKINDHEHNAAQRYRSAWDKIQSTVGGAMDFERARGGGMPGGLIAQPYLAAADEIRQVRVTLGGEDFQIVHRIAGLCYTIQDVAGQMGGTRQAISSRLKKALGRLADFWEMGKRWEGAQRRRLRIYAHRGFEPSELQSTGENVARAKVAHADRRGVRYKKA
jgi:hypothetical protein